MQVAYITTMTKCGYHCRSTSSPYFSFLLNPPPPRSTLFPYTTLFRSLELPLGDLQLIGDHLQVALKVRIRLFILRQPVLQRGHILLNLLLGCFQLCCHCLLGAIELRRRTPAESQST